MSLERSNLSLTREDRPKVFEMCDREWDLLDEVFAPVYSPSTGVSLEFLGLTDISTSGRNGSLLEIGCGAGVAVVMAALTGEGRVVGSDINPQAVANTRLNAARHGVQDRVTVLQGDLFSELADGERFDTVFWSSNYVRAPKDYVYKSLHEAAYVDADYRAHRVYLTEAPKRTTDGGSALLHFSSRGDLAELHRLAADCGRELRTLKSIQARESEYGDHVVEHLLLEISAVAD
ncbi:methyltransferase domain-containing protein [Streptacidiphilus fuscans]|uniref:methyltransferase domain-containing protein n=1 Tax=Streptacidiphilus fuscans TaxID=2789292 RepID=UPI001F47ABB7|nr:methyltransferase domain-containing protein [Streptacidiphilus fuscans]